MKTTIENLTLVEVCERLDIIAKSESIICKSALIYSDMCIALDEFTKQFKSNSKPREWYFAIRENGTEDNESRAKVVQRCTDLGAAHIAIKVEYNSTTDSYKVIIVR
jgi:hypothetical protein